jgi:hypothetical protein
MALFRYWFFKELAMVIPIDAVRYGAGFDTTGRWHEAEAEFVSFEQQRQAAEVMAPARGAVCGLLFSAMMWVGLAAAVRGMLTLVK